jgi:hypothetical protein
MARTSSNQLPEGLGDFKEMPLAPGEKERDGLFTEMQFLRLRDMSFRYWARYFVGIALMILLFVQYLVIYAFAATAFDQFRIEEVTVLLSIVIPGVLAETAAIVHTMVKWIFGETDYRRHK